MMSDSGGPAALAVFASGSGSNLGALIDRFGAEGAPDTSARVALVLTDRFEIEALERAEATGVPAATIRPQDHEGKDAFGDAILAALRAHAIELVALAGYLRLLPPGVVSAYRGKIINIHPAPLPAFGGPGMYGHRVHGAVIESGVRVSGPTIHFVDERYDTGAIIAQWPVPVLPGDTPDSLAARVLRYEHRLYPPVVSALARGEVRLGEDGRAVVSVPAPPGAIGFGASSEEGSLDSIESFWVRGR